MRLASKQDLTTIRQRFFAAVGEEFKRGATSQKLTELSIKRGVWAGVEDELLERGAQSQIKFWVRSAKDEQGRRIYYSLPALDAAGKEIPKYYDVAFLEIDHYKILLAECENDIKSQVVIYRELMNQAQARFGYKHKVPAAIRPLLDGLE